MHRAIIVVAGSALCIAALAAPAQAVTLVTSDEQVAQPYQQWAAASKVPTVPGPVTLHLAPCPDISTATESFACVEVGLDRDLWFPPNTLGMGRFELLHELGHVFDRAMPGAARAGFLKITGQPGRPWRDGSATRPVEQWADAYANCAVGNTPDGNWQTDYGYDPTPRQQRRVCLLVRRVAARMDG